MPARILIADDSPSVRTALRQLLSGFDWEILEAEDGEQAVSKSLELLPAVAIVDLAMPGMDGLTAARHIHDQQPEIPILMCTMYWSAQLDQDAVKFGVQKVIPKNDSAGLISAIQAALTSQPRPSASFPLETSKPTPESAPVVTPLDPPPIPPAIATDPVVSTDKVVAAPTAASDRLKSE
jgi:CheY-like chemotaxis protein